MYKNIVDTIIANSEETKKSILYNNPKLFDPGKIKVIYNGIYLSNKMPDRTLLQRENNEIILGNSGRLVKQKGHRYLIDIAKILAEENINFKLVIAGEGKLEKELKKHVNNLNLNDRVIFLGFVKDMQAFMNSIDIFLLTSLWEGFGYVIIEAMACKKPVIAFDVSSNPEIIENDKTGYLIKNRSLNEFAEKIKILAADKEMRNRFGSNGRKRVESRFTFARSLKQVEEIIDY